MPIYEYICLDCGAQFDALRSMKDADAPLACQQCQGENTARQLSVFFAQSEGRVVAGGNTGGAGCASCASRTCATCGN